MTTGADFDKIIDLKFDQPFSPYFSSQQKNRIIKEAVMKAIRAKAAENDRIQTQSDLFGIYKSEVVFTSPALASNEVDLIASGSGITDYYLMMNLKAKFVEPLSPTYISEAANTSPLRIKTSKKTNLRTKEQVVISGVTTNTNANGTRYLKAISRDKYQLYSDINLITPISGNGAYTGTVGSISRVVYNYARNYHSIQKFSTLNTPTIHDPYYEIASTVVKVFPLTFPCSEITVDYVTTPVFPDVLDTTIDLEETYSLSFIYYLASAACELFGMSDRDDQLVQNSVIEQSRP